jgi:hypothetical protein
VRGGVGQEHADLAVVDLPRRAGVLPGDSGRADAFLDEPGVVDDEHTRGVVAEGAQDVAADVVTDAVDIPARGAQQPLHAVRGHRPGVLSQRPAVLALESGQQPAQIRSHPPPRLYS